MSGAVSHLQHCYAIQGGRIDPWGTISVLYNGIAEPGEDDPVYQGYLNLQPGLKVWSERLVQYGKGNHRARVAKDVIEVLDQSGSVVDKVPHADSIDVDIQESHVHDNGYLEYLLVREGGSSSGLWIRILEALNQVERGERPDFFDNSPFVQVDKKLAGQELIALRYDISDDEGVVVYTKDGERVPSKFHHPLSFAKWEPTSNHA